MVVLFLFFFFQAEDGIRGAQESRGLGDVYKRQDWHDASLVPDIGVLGSHDLVAIDLASADLINRSIGLRDSSLSRAFQGGQDKFLDVHPVANWRTQIDYAQLIGLGNTDYSLKEIK